MKVTTALVSSILNIESFILKRLIETKAVFQLICILDKLVRAALTQEIRKEKYKQIEIIFVNVLGA